MFVFMSVPFRRHRLSENRGRCVPARWKANAILIVLATMSLRNMAVAEKDYRSGAMRLSSSCKLKRRSLKKGIIFSSHPCSERCSGDMVRHHNVAAGPIQLRI